MSINLYHKKIVSNGSNEKSKTDRRQIGRKSVIVSITPEQQLEKDIQKLVRPFSRSKDIKDLKAAILILQSALTDLEEHISDKEQPLFNELNAKILTILGNVYIRNNQYSEASAQFSLAIKINEKVYIQYLGR